MSKHTWTVNPVGVAEICAGDETKKHLETEYGQPLADRINATTHRVVDIKGSWKADGLTVVTSSSYWYIAEFGTRYTPPYATVRNAMQALGFTQIDMHPGAV